LVIADTIVDVIIQRSMILNGVVTKIAININKLFVLFQFN